MADPIDELEKLINKAVAEANESDAIIAIHKAIDTWRNQWGGNRAYIAKHSHGRRQAKIAQLAEKGLKPEEIAKQVGASSRQIRRVTSKKSSYL